MYGNPGANQKLYIVSNQNANIDVRIHNSVGQLVKSTKYGATRGSNMFELDLQKMAKGVYILDVFDELTGLRKVFKLVR